MIIKIAVLLNSICIILMLFMLSKQYADMGTLWDTVMEIDTMFKDIIDKIKDEREGVKILWVK
jgi:hypothetical protein